ncbi:MAG: outer membrane beta-barrel protein [Alistipes sp.]|nr:outer membrane beta-barrel protein [Alistipes sp.]
MKTRYYLLLLTLLLCGSGVSTLQAKGPIQLGIKAGLQSQSMHASKDDLLGVFSADRDFGYQLGFVARFNLPMWYVQPELVYANHRFTMNMEDDASTKVRVNNLELPILVGWKIAFFRLFGGPVFTLMNNTSTKMKSSSEAINVELIKSTIAYQLGVGVELGRIGVDMRYGGQFKKAEYSVMKGTQPARNYRMSMNQWQLNVCYMF